MANNARKVLTALAGKVGFSVYGMGEFTPDVETVNVDEAMEHIEAQDETLVYLFNDGVAVGSLAIIGEDGEFEVYDYGMKNRPDLEIIVDNLTR